jgi:hypothetical protein
MVRSAVHVALFAPVVIAVAIAGCGDESSESSADRLVVPREQVSQRAQDNTGTTPETPMTPTTSTAVEDPSHACLPAYIASVVSVSYGAKSGYGQDRLPDVVLGPPHGAGDTQGSLDVLSLGRGGEIVIEFGADVIDGDGADLIVFENAFFVGGDTNDVYHELAEVAVSADGAQWTTFPCSTTTHPFDGCAGWRPVHSHPNNRVSPSDPAVSGGDPFDLTDVGVERARYVRIRDISGSGSGETAGFDLDAAVARHVDCHAQS